MLKVIQIDIKNLHNSSKKINCNFKTKASSRATGNDAVDNDDGDVSFGWREQPQNVVENTKALE